MKELLCATAITLITSAATAAELSPANPIERPITNKDGEVKVGMALAYGSDDYNDDWDIGLGASYGINDNLTLGLGGITYRFIEREDNASGLELAVSGGLKGYYSYRNIKGYAWGVDLTGKYVFSEDLALTFGTGAVRWNEDNHDGRHEMRFNLGVQKRLIDKLTLSTGVSYRDFSSGFAQDHAYAYHVGLNYQATPQLDVGIFGSYTDFDADANEFATDDFARRKLGVSVSYRF